MSHLTQIPGSTQKQVCDIVIGFDFGTSCTKVVIRTPNLANRTFAVPFGDYAHPSCKYLLPTVLWIEEKDGTLSLEASPGAHEYRDIKYHMISKNDSQHEDSWACGAAFIALALREARAWFIHTHGRAYQDQRLEWQVNVGLPSADYADQDLCSKYVRMLKAAWVLSLLSNPPGYSNAHEAFDRARSELGEKQAYIGTSHLDGAELCIIPEVAAEVVGYARSDKRREGLHLLIDVGASTLDICGFILHRQDGDDCYRLLTADVRQLGGLMLFRTQLTAVLTSVQDYGDELFSKFDPVSTIPPQPEGYVPPRQRLYAAADCGSKDYQKDCAKMIWKTVFDLRTKRDPNSLAWKAQLPVFLVGGGSLMPCYRNILGSISKKFSEQYCRTSDGFKTVPFEKPDPLEGEISGHEYHRLAVAWGLSYPSVDIGEVTRPEEIEDIPQFMRISRGVEYPSKDVT